MQRRFVLFAWLISWVAFCCVPVQALQITLWQPESGERLVRYRNLVNQFSLQTGILVKIESIDGAEMPEKLAVARVSGNGPDVAVVGSTWATALADQGAFADLSSYIKADVKSRWTDLFPAAMELWRNYKGQQFGIGSYLDITALYYNKQLFKQFGVTYPLNYTWKDTLTAASKMTQDNSGDGLPDTYGMTEWWFNWQPIVWSYGGDFVNASRTGSALRSTEARTALELYKQFFATRVMPTVDDWKRLNQPHPAALWRSGAIAMAPGGTSLPNYWARDVANGNYILDFDIAEIPASAPGRRVTTMEGSGLVVMNSSPNKDAAYRFIAYMQSERVQSQLASMHNFLPTRVGVARALIGAIGKNTRNTVALLLATEYARPYPRGFDWWGRIWPAVTKQTSRYFAGDISLEEMLTQTDSQIKTLLADDPILKQNR